MEEVKELNYLGTVLSKHGAMDRKLREGAEKDKRVIRSLASVMKARNESMEIKRDLRNSILFPTLTNALETWIWNRAQQSKMYVVEISYLIYEEDVA